VIDKKQDDTGAMTLRTDLGEQTLKAAARALDRVVKATGVKFIKDRAVPGSATSGQAPSDSSK
jgi:hypothetical protein